MSLSRSSLELVDRAVRRKARREKAGQPPFGLREDQERVGHRRRQKPFVAADGVTLARAGAVEGNGRRGVGANVGAALTFRHAHADGDGLLLLPGSKSRVVAPHEQLWQHCAGEYRLVQERSDGGVGHGDGAAMARLHLRCHVAARAPCDMGPRPRTAPCRQIVPSRAVKALRRAEPHQPVISGVVVYPVQPASLRIEGAEPRGVLIGLPPEISCRGAAGDPAESGKVFGGIGAPLAGDGLAQGDV